MKLVLDSKGLAEALSMSPLTVRQSASRNPERLPPRLAVPGRKLLWAVKDVEEWIEKHRSTKSSGDQDSAKPSGE
jgi:predicted DNA-binding transcriptional regulator AlpA